MTVDLQSRLQATLDMFTIERELGGGGMSRVFVAVERALGRRVVIKVLAPSVAADLSSRRFAREIRLAACLQQANIVPVLSVGETDGLPYYTMPFIEGLSLRQRLERGAVPISEIVGVLRDVARALAYAHEHGVVHRDIKPDNILLSGAAAVVADFGIAKAISDARNGGSEQATTVTRAGMAIGTPAYMAPEQVAADPEIDHRADLYSFGCVAYELLTGEAPFADRAGHQMMAHITEQPVPVLEKRPDCPQGLAGLVMQCLEKDPAARPQSAVEILRVLDDATASGGSPRDGLSVGRRHVTQTAPSGTASLPVPLSPFIGRDSELAELTQLLGSSRLVTVTGAGGSGKTRLALEAARRLAVGECQRVDWVELAPLGRGDLLAQHVAAQLHVLEAPNHPLVELLIVALGSGKQLLVLDNCEHLVDACAELVTLLLKRCEHLTVLATSREALGIEGERAWLLRGLTTDAPPSETPDDMPLSDAMRLFVDRACAVSTSFHVSAANAPAIAQICRRLDGLPLAIELAAARVAVLAPEEIAARLDRAFGLLTTGSRTALPRHRTLRAAVEWSYRLISVPEQTLLQCLSVFAGTFSLEAVERVCEGDGLGTDDVLDLLASLVTRSLVTMQEEAGTARYGLLEIVRQFAWERLAERPAAPAALQRRHAEYYLSLAMRARPDLERYHSPLWLARIRAEHDNLGAALHWAFSDGDRTIGHRLVGTLWQFWGQTAQWSEGAHWLDEALRGPEPPDSPAWGEVLNGAGSFAYLAGDIERGQPLLERAANVLARTGDRAHQVMAMSTRAHLLCSIGEVRAALELAESALPIARTVPEVLPLCHLMANAVGHAYTLLGEYDRADACLREAFERAQRDGGRILGLSYVAHSRAGLAITRGRLEDAREHLRNAIAVVREIKDPHHSTRVLLRATRLLSELGCHAAAARVAGAIASARDAGMPVLPDEVRSHNETVGALRTRLGDSRYDVETDQGRPWTLWEALTFADDELRGASATPESARPSVARETSAVESRGPELQVRALGGLDVVMDGAPTAAAVWTHAKPRELLAYLLSHPEGRTREQIGLAFWPEASSSQVKNSFHVLLHKVRKGLGRSDAIIAVGERYRINPDAAVWFDAAIFEREMSAVLRTDRRNVERLESALALYRGDFLEGETVGDWSLEIHDRLRRLYVDGLSLLADLKSERQDLEGAREALEHLVQKEELREEAYRRLMVCLARLGRRDQALRHYGRLTDILRTELDSEPEAETAALAERLSQSASV